MIDLVGNNVVKVVSLYVLQMSILISRRLYPALDHYCHHSTATAAAGLRVQSLVLNHRVPDTVRANGTATSAPMRLLRRVADLAVAAETNRGRRHFITRGLKLAEMATVRVPNYSPLHLHRCRLSFQATIPSLTAVGPCRRRQSLVRSSPLYLPTQPTSRAMW